MESETTVPKELVIPTNEFLLLPSLGSLDFTNLVNDIKCNSRLPSVGKDLTNPICHSVHPNLDIEVKRQFNSGWPYFNTQASVTLDNTSNDNENKTNTVTRGTLSTCPSSLPVPITVNDGTSIKNAIFDETESTLVKDLLLVFQGHNGVILRWNENNCFGFCIDEKLLHPAHKTLALRMCSIGVNHKMIKAQLCVPTRGKCFESLKFFFQSQLHEFDLMVLRLEQLVNGQGNSVDMERYSKIVPYGSDSISLNQLECLMYDSRKLLKTMSSMLSRIQPDTEGGQLCSVLYEFTQHGDPEIQDFAYKTLAYVARPICQGPQDNVKKIESSKSQHFIMG